jgi:hypothetical protein
MRLGSQDLPRADFEPYLDRLYAVDCLREVARNRGQLRESRYVLPTESQVMKNRWLFGTYIERSSVFCDPSLFAIQVLHLHMSDTPVRNV